MYPDHERDSHTGISAVLIAPAKTDDPGGAVLDLAAVLDGLVNEKFEIILVEGDATARVTEIMAELRVRFPSLPMRLLEAARGGQPAAVAAALEVAAYDLIFVIVGHGRYNVHELNHLLDAIERGSDLAIGYRPRRTDGLTRCLQGWGWNGLVNLVFGPAARDLDCAFKLFRRALWQRVGLQASGSEATFCAELVVCARRLGFKVTEIPVSQSQPDRGMGAGLAMSGTRAA